MIQLYDPSLSLSERQELFFELESLGEAMPNRHICSSFHFLMGRTSLRLDLPTEVSWAFGLTRQSRHPEIALDFLHYLTSLKANQQFADMTGNVPSIVGASVPEDMEVFAPKVDGYPEGIDPGRGGETAALSNAHFHLTSSYPLAGASMRILTRCVVHTLPQPFATSTQRSTVLSKKPGIKTPISPPNGPCKRSA